jgi:DNA-binding transcriptional regulator YiaG
VVPVIFYIIYKGVRSDRSAARRKRRWFVSPEGFRELRLTCLLSQRACADLLGVGLRSVRNWDRGISRVPWVVVRLLRILRNGELPGDAWAGWRLWGGTLWTPEGHAVHAREASWLSLLVRQARAYREISSRPSAGQGLPVGASVADACPVLPAEPLLIRGESVAGCTGARSAPGTGLVSFCNKGEVNEETRMASGLAGCGKKQSPGQAGACSSDGAAVNREGRGVSQSAYPCARLPSPSSDLNDSRENVA